MEEGVHIECFNFLNFFLGVDLAEMDGCVHLALRTADPELSDVAVRVLRADNNIIKIVGDDNIRNVEEFLWFMVRPGMEIAFFQRDIFVSPNCVVSKERMFIEIKTVQKLHSALKKRMFLEKGDSGGAVFGSILYLAL
jgi:hypothetical protein